MGKATRPPTIVQRGWKQTSIGWLVTPGALWWKCQHGWVVDTPGALWVNAGTVARWYAGHGG